MHTNEKCNDPTGLWEDTHPDQAGSEPDSNQCQNAREIVVPNMHESFQPIRIYMWQRFSCFVVIL
jgi:hypothetical protein